MMKHTEKLESAEPPLTTLALKRFFNLIEGNLSVMPNEEMPVAMKRAFRSQLEKAALTGFLPETLSQLKNAVRYRVNLEGIANEAYPESVFTDLCEKGLRAAGYAMQNPPRLR